MPARLFFSWKAEEDLTALYQGLAMANPGRAREFLRSIEARCESLLLFPRQGRARDDLLPGVRILPYAGAAVIAYRVRGEEVSVERVFTSGQDYERLLNRSP